ncbi:glutamic acid-rich protein-like [Lytechinus variegatus]|uniref:glutamic acid-rich protein-like n=1 Tax=Lytechinus variegatus TaxID=7654 RepID=UPI001BB0DD0C|nr:glutamic acid-rich protein-like [Lytechinus variegatus]
MKIGSILQTSFVVVMVILVVIAGADAKKRNRKRPPDTPGKLKDTPRKGSNSPPGAGNTQPGQDTALTTTVPAENVPQADPAVAPEVENPSSKSKQKEKHRNRGGKRHRDHEDESSDVTDVKEKGNRKKDRSEKKKHHKKHNQEAAITTTRTTTTTLSMTENSNELPEEPVAENEPTIVEETPEPVAEGDPLVEPEVDSDDDVEATMITTSTTTTVSSKKHHRDREAKKLMRDQAQTDREARKLRKEEKKREKKEKRKLAKNNPDSADELELTVNPTPSPVADGINLTPSGPSPVQTTQQQPTQTEAETNKKDKKNKKERLAENTELSRTEKRIQRLERKMRKLGHNRKNATRIPCEDHENCQEGQCCLLRRGNKVCHIVNKPEGHHCVHPCMCSQGLTCLGKNQKQKSLSKGHCRRIDIAETAVEGGVADNRAPATVNEGRTRNVPNVG